MIDLHMHTSYSDGTDSVKEILKNAKQANLETISITDHNTCDAYQEMKKINVSEFYDGNIIVGCEFTTSYDNRLIEVLGYGFDDIKVNKSLNSFYSKELVNERTNILYNRLLGKISDLGLIFNLSGVREKKFENEFFERRIYEELSKHSENKELLKEDVWNSFSDFFRKGLTNPTSKLFINHAEFKPSLKEIINLVHEAGGIVFLAHPYQYKFNDTEEFLDKIYDDNDFDGIECFYTTFTKKQSDYLVEFAHKRNLLISGGSDYHGLNKQHHDLGTGNGNLHISQNIISNWDIKYLKKDCINNLEFMSKFKPDIRCIKEFDYWIVCIREKQTTLGSAVILLKRETPSVGDILPEESSEFPKVVKWYEEICIKKFGAIKFNYIIMMMYDPFVHYHAFPRYDKKINLFGLEWEDKNTLNHFASVETLDEKTLLDIRDYMTQ